MSFLEMPNSLPAPEVKTETLTAVRLRDVKTGKFVAAPSLVYKSSSTVLDSVSLGIPLGWLGVEKAKKRKKKSLDPKLSVKLEKKPK